MLWREQEGERDQMAGEWGGATDPPDEPAILPALLSFRRP